MVGISPYQRAQEAWLGLVKLVQKLTDQGAFYVPHSMKLSCSYRDKEGVDAIEMKISVHQSVLLEAQVVSDVLKECKDLKKLHKIKKKS